MVALFLFLPEEFTNSAWESYRRLRHDPAQIAFDTLRKTLPDPASARILSFEKIVKDEAYSKYDTYLLRYASRNAYGEYGIDEKFVKEDGSTDVLYYAERLTFRNKVAKAGSVAGTGCLK